MVTIAEVAHSMYPLCALSTMISAIFYYNMQGDEFGEPLDLQHRYETLKDQYERLVLLHCET